MPYGAVHGRQRSLLFHGLVHPVAILEGRHMDARKLSTIPPTNQHHVQAGSELSADRMMRLQSVIASLAGNLTPEEVADTVLDQAIQALRADAGSVVVATDDETRLQRISAVGYPPEVLARFGNYTLTDPFPMTEAMQTGEAIWLSSLAEWRERYPELAGFQQE